MFLSQMELHKILKIGGGAWRNLGMVGDYYPCPLFRAGPPL